MVVAWEWFTTRKIPASAATSPSSSFPENLLNDRKALDRFIWEARAASQLNHPGICTIHDIGDMDAHPFMVMEKLEGVSLKDRMLGKPMDVEEILDIGIQVADALAACHAKGIIHRDIKPANIFITQSGQIKILDFGVAKLAPGLRAGAAALDTELSVAGDIFGTAVYMSPEQARGEELDPRTDLFSLGVVLYQMATGQKPFIGTNTVTTLEAIMNHKPVSPLKLNPALPKDLEGILGRAMEKDRGNRYPNALAMKGDLQSLKRETEPGLTTSGKLRSPLPYRISSNTFQTSNRRQTYILLGVIALLITLLVPMGAWWYKQRPGARGRNTIAVLPLQNMNGDVSVDFLRFALADEIANALTYTRTLDVRPSSMTRKYVGVDEDPRQVGSELRVATVVTGHFLKQGDRLMVTLEAIESSTDRLLWQTTLTAPAAGPHRVAIHHGCPGKSRVAPCAWYGRRCAQCRQPSRKIRRPTISTCTAWRCRMTRDPTRMPSWCWSTRCRAIRTTPRRGRSWVCATTTTPAIPTAGKRCSSAPPKRTSALSRWIPIASWPPGNSSPIGRAG